METIPAFKLIPEPMTAEAKAMPKFRWAPPEADAAKLAYARRTLEK